MIRVLGGVAVWLQRILRKTKILVRCWLVVHADLDCVQRVCYDVRWILVVMVDQMIRAHHTFFNFRSQFIS